MPDFGGQDGDEPIKEKIILPEIGLEEIEMKTGCCAMSCWGRNRDSSEREGYKNEGKR